MKNKKYFALANEISTGEEAGRDADVNRPQGLVGLENEFSLGEDGWVLIAPYGDSLKERETRGADGTVKAERFLQRFTPAAGQELARRANSLWGKIKRFRIGIPIFRRHPDLRAVSPSTVALGNQGEATEHGVFAEIEARAAGLYGRPVMTRAGQLAIENEGLKWLSPFWWTKRIGEENGATVVEPVELISAGLTDRPNIAGGEALANQGEFSREVLADSQNEKHEKTEKDMKDKLIKVLALLGVPLANEADEAAIEAGVQAAVDAAKAKADEALANEAKEKDSREAREKRETDQATKITALENENGTLVTCNSTMLGKFQAERQARIALLLDGAVGTGRITVAERPSWAEALANEAAFDAKAGELGALQVKVKTQSSVGDIGSRKAEAARETSKGGQIVALANERLKDFNGDWDQAYASVRKSHPALFGK